jgi:hypothetical protein
VSSAPSGPLHYQRADGKTVCGLDIRGSIRVTGDPHKIECRRCKGSPYMDDELASWHA